MAHAANFTMLAFMLLSHFGEDVLCRSPAAPGATSRICRRPSSRAGAGGGGRDGQCGLVIDGVMQLATQPA